jgi:hypothetical protein
MGILDNLEHAAGLGGEASQTGTSAITAMLEMLQSQPGEDHAVKAGAKP